MRIHTHCISAVLALVARGGKPMASETRTLSRMARLFSLSIKYLQAIRKAEAKPSQLRKNQITKDQSVFYS